jgi:hypothetical protein
MCVEAMNPMVWKLAVSVVPLAPASENADSLLVKMSFRLGDNEILTEEWRKRHSACEGCQNQKASKEEKGCHDQA